MTKPLRVLALCVALVAGLGACAGITERPDPPRVSLAGLRMLEMNLFEQRYELKLRIQNPNDFALPIEGMSYELFLNGHAFAHGVSNSPVDVPAYGEATLDVGVVSNLARVFDQIRDLERGGARGLSYKLVGAVDLGGIPGKVPFEYAGELAPPDVGGAGPPPRAY